MAWIDSWAIFSLNSRPSNQEALPAFLSKVPVSKWWHLLSGSRQWDCINLYHSELSTATPPSEVSVIRHGLVKLSSYKKVITQGVLVHYLHICSFSLLFYIKRINNARRSATSGNCRRPCSKIATDQSPVRHTMHISASRT